jgi:hypothetical protein
MGSRRFIVTKRFLVPGLLVVLAACSEEAPGGGIGDRVVGDGEIAGKQEGNGDRSPAFASDSAGAAGAPGAASPSTGGGNGSVGPGILTAGAWDDNRNFDLFSSYRSTHAQMPGLLPIPDAEYQAARAAAVVAPHQTLDVSLVIDTTGSMGDEIAYLQKEFDALATTIQTKYPGSAQHWSLVLYRDTTDDYVVRWFDFRDTPNEFKSKLATASAGGGGDTPEAPDQALDIAHRLSWRSSADTAKLLFWVADAPHHVGNEGRLASAIRASRDKGIHIYPVASSGVDELSEHSMRSAAQLTGGRYLFLTDDSGVGGAHKEASVPCYFVTKLDRAILRMVDIEMSGQYREPDAADVLRTGGDPQSGVCTLSSGTTVTIY